MAEDRTVYVVHCVDAEGPLYESLQATFERIEAIFGVRLPPKRETLRGLQRREINLGGVEESIARVVAPHLIDYNDTWDKIDAMLDRISAESYRNQLPDSDGGGWVYNWHCVDHVEYLDNPRKRDMGYHNIFDHYRTFIQETQSPDGLHFHFHPTHPSRAAHKSGTFYLRDTKFFDILARRVLDRHWFPSVNRAGFHMERPDSHWLLEQWIPFDLSNQACDNVGDNADIAGGRFGDWRRAPKEWTVYHPDQDDYQVQGSCRRTVARCLNVGTRYHLLDEAEVRKAFEHAKREGPTLMAFTNHDFRDMARDVDMVRDLLRTVAPDYPDVRFRFSEAREAMNRVLYGEYRPPASCILSATVEEAGRGGAKVLSVKASEPTFGPQPFLAIRTIGGQYLYENLDFQTPFRSWSYVFDELTLPWSVIDRVAVATNDARGFPHVLEIPCGSAHGDPGKSHETG